MTRLCPVCSHVIPAGIRAGFCPRCSIAGAADLRDGEVFVAAGEPHLVANYELEELLGRGGMGLVYRARQRGLDRMVAVKLLAAGEFANAGARKRFQQEAGAVARLRHPNIVAVHEVGEHHGQPFFSMELVEGRTFAELTQDGPVPPREAARLLQPVARAVQFAHEQGVLHRDLKPSNLLLDAFGQPKVSDFGLARRLDAAERLTLSGEVLGSPSYLAPEQARGDRDQEGPATDVYALGAILYQLITGRPPHVGHSPAAVLRQVIEHDPLPPRTLNPQLPRDLETICLKCLEKEPSRRYSSALEVAEELARFERGDSLRAKPVGLAGRAARWARRHPARTLAAGALIIAALTVIVVPSVAYMKVRQAEAQRAGQLRETLLNEARALRLGGRPGQQRDSWAALRLASQSWSERRTGRAQGATSFVNRLRNEAIATLALDDAWTEPLRNAPEERDATYLSIDSRQQTFAHGSFRGPLRIVDVDGSRQALEIPLGARSLQHVLDFSPSGRFIAVRHGGAIAIWDLTNRAVAVEQPSWLNRYSFHPGSEAVAFLRTNGSVAGFSLPGGALLWEWPAGARSDAAISFAPNGSLIAIGVGGQGGVEIRHSRNGTLVLSLASSAPARTLAWSGDSRWVAAGAEDGRVRAWDLTSGPLVGRSGAQPLDPTWIFEAHTEPVRALAFSPNGRWVASSGADDMVRLLDVRRGRSGLTFPGEAYQLVFTAVTNGAANSRVGPVWHGGRPVWIQVSDAAVLSGMRLPPVLGLAPTVALDRVGSRIAIASRRHVLVYDTNFETPPDRYPVLEPRAAYFLESNAIAAVSLHESRLFAPGQTETFVKGAGEVASFSVNKAIIALADYVADSVLVFSNRAEIRRLPHFRVACVAVDPKGERVVSTSLDQGDTRLWEIASGRELKTWMDEGANRVVFSPDGRWLAQFGPRCVIWDTRDWTKRVLQPDLPPNSGPADAVFNEDGTTLAAIMADREIQLFRVPDFEHVATLDAGSGRLHRLAWSADGSRLAALAAQNEVFVWHVPFLRSRLEPLRVDWQLR